MLKVKKNFPTWSSILYIRRARSFMKLLDLYWFIPVASILFVPLFGKHSKYYPYVPVKIFSLCAGIALGCRDIKWHGTQPYFWSFNGLLGSRDKHSTDEKEYTRAEGKAGGFLFWSVLHSSLQMLWKANECQLQSTQPLLCEWNIKPTEIGVTVFLCSLASGEDLVRG